MCACKCRQHTEGLLNCNKSNRASRRGTLQRPFCATANTQQPTSKQAQRSAFARKLSQTALCTRRQQRLLTHSTATTPLTATRSVHCAVLHKCMKQRSHKAVQDMQNGVQTAATTTDDDNNVNTLQTRGSATTGGAQTGSPPTNMPQVCRLSVSSDTPSGQMPAPTQTAALYTGAGNPLALTAVP
jgi:hypothetical protein